VVKAISVLLAGMRTNQENVRFADAMRVGEHYFGPPRRSGSSHHVFKMPWPGNPRINLQEAKNGKAKAYQVRQLIQAIDQLGGLKTNNERGKNNG
jgi:hypothetical protein